MTTPILSTPHITELEALLVELQSAHERLITAAEAQRAAVRTADPDLVAQCSNDQSQVLRDITKLEERRRALVAALTAGFPKRAPGQGPITLSELAKMTPEPHRTRLVELAANVRKTVERAAERQRTLRAATASLLAHMEGLMRQVAQRLSHAGTYGRRGMIDSVPAVVSGLDLVT